MKIVFFGSFQHYSALILKSLILNHKSINILGVVTTPPMPVGRKQIITKTPVHELAEKHNLPVFTPETLDKESLQILLSSVNDHRSSVIDFFVTAGYSKILTADWLKSPTSGALNLHFSLLPKFRGANPAEWAIMMGETSTGITLMKMNEGLDKGDVIYQKDITITPEDTRETIYQKLYELGARELPAMLMKYFQWSHKQDFACQQSLTPQPQPLKSTTPYAALLKRDDGFIPWTTIGKAMQGNTLTEEDFPSKHLKTAVRAQSSPPAEFLSRLPRALAGYPGLWTTIPTNKGDKRMKILSIRLAPGRSHIVLDYVQLEGQQPAFYNQIKNQITK